MYDESIETLKKVSMGAVGIFVGLFNIAMGVNMKEWVFIAGGGVIVAVVFFCGIAAIVEKVRR